VTARFLTPASSFASRPPCRAFVPAAVFFCLFLVAAPLARADQSAQAPWEALNRKTHSFNDWFDDRLLHPVSKVYRDHAPHGVQVGVGNFFYNLSEPAKILNSLLQGRFGQGLKHTARLLVNSTIGMGGLVDIATPMGLTRGAADKTLGHTLQRWGVDSGPYLVLPFLGPSTVRDALGRPVDGATNGATYFETQTAASFVALRAVDGRAKIPEAEGLLGADPYIALRELYFSRRASSPGGNGLDAEEEAEAIFDDDF